MKDQIHPGAVAPLVRHSLGRRLHRRIFLGTLTAAMVASSNAEAATAQPQRPSQGILYFVNNSGDASDLFPGDNQCDTDGFGTCTLRAAIQETNARSTGEDGISIDVSEVDLATALPDLTTSIDIFGAGPDAVTVTTVTQFKTIRIFNSTVASPGAVFLSGMTITRAGINSQFAPTCLTDSGAGVANSGTGTVNITNCVITGNVGGVSNGTGTVNITGCTIDNNQTSEIGAGVCMDGGTVTILNSSVSGNLCFVGTAGTVQSEGGGIFCNAGLLIISNTVIGGNQCLVSQPSSFPKGGGIFVNNGILVLSNSTVEFNSLFGLDGIPPTEGGGLINLSGSVSILNCTFRGNSALIGAGLSNDFGFVSFTNSTMSANGNSDTQVAGGLLNEAGLVNLSNSTFSGNTSADDYGVVNIASAQAKSSLFDDRVSGSFISQGFNLVRIVDGATGFTAATDQTGTVAFPLDPMLDPAGLQDNGGPTLTIALLPGSPALDQASSQAIDLGLTTDQRGFGFPRTFDNLFIPNAVGGDGTDVGAFEVQMVPLSIVSSVSRKVHTSAGTFDVDLPLSGTPGIECRTGGDTGVFQVIVTFSTSVVVAVVTATPDPNAPGATGMVSDFSMNGAQVTINLVDVSNAQTLLISLIGVSNGGPSSDFNISMSVLLGDTIADGSVDSSDSRLVKSDEGQSVDPSNFREDVTLDGVVSRSDTQTVKAQKRTFLP